MTSLLIPEPPLQVLPTLAKLIGLNEAIFLQQLHYWLLRATREKEGRKWVFKTYEEWQDDFPFWSVPTIRRVVGRLEGKHLILTTSEWNRMPIDQTKWYSIDYERLTALTTDHFDQMDRSKRSDTSDHFDQMVGSFWADVSDQVDQTNNQRIETTTETTIPETTTTAPGGRSGDPVNTYTLFEDEKFGKLTPLVADELADLIKTYGEPAVLDALRIAVLQNVRKLTYVRGILERQREEADRPDLGGAERYIREGVEY